MEGPENKIFVSWKKFTVFAVRRYYAVSTLEYSINFSGNLSVLQKSGKGC